MEGRQEEFVGRGRSLGVSRTWTTVKGEQSVSRSVSISFNRETVNVCVKREDGNWDSPATVSAKEISINDVGEPTWKGQVVRIDF